MSVCFCAVYVDVILYFLSVACSCFHDVVLRFNERMCFVFYRC